MVAEKAQPQENDIDEAAGSNNAGSVKDMVTENAMEDLSVPQPDYL